MRTLGLELLATSAGYEGLVVRDARTASVAGLVARQRRLLQAAYRLIDAGDLLEAQILVRSQVEFLIVQKWLQLDPELHYPLWVIEDVRARFALRDDVLAAYGTDVLDAGTVRRYEQARDDRRAELARICEQRGINVLEYPKLIDQAKAVDEAGTYALVYRYDSQAAVHPRSLAVEQLLDQVPDGIAIRGEPHNPWLDIYANSAVALLVALQKAKEYSEELDFVEIDALDQEISEHRVQREGDQR